MLKVALIGLGGMGRGHLANYQRLMAEGYPVQLVAVCDIDEAKFRKNDIAINIETGGDGLELGDVKLYTDYKQMISELDLDYVDTPLPTYEHAKAAIYALEHGLHVLCEKPMALTVEQCKEMIAARDRSGKTLMIAQCLRFWPAYETLKAYVDEKTYGEVTSAYFFRGGSTPMWSYNNWLQKKELSGGVLLDQHVHDVDTINWLFGMPDSVCCLAKNVIPGSGYDAVSTQYFYPDGKVVNAQDDWTINGDFGFEMIFRVNFERGCLVLSRQGLTVYPVGAPAFVPDLPADDGYYREIRYFLNCLEKGLSPDRCTPESTMDTIRIASAEQRSADTGSSRVNPAAL